MSKRRRQPTPKREWQPLQRATVSPEMYRQHDITPPDRAYLNDLYSVFVREIGHGALHLSFHRHDRKAVRDWRHFQQIKNETAGPERLAIEVFPPESMLVDAANEYHLWVFPPGWEEQFPFLLPVRNVMTQEEGEQLYGKSKARQRPWQEGLTTGQVIA
jgi:hypothetical protein